MKEEIIYVVDSLGVSHPETFEKPGFSISQLFMEGGALGMTIITIFLIALLVAAWKAPRWVKEIGIGALVVAILWNMMGIYQAFGVVEQVGDISMSLLCGGIRVTMISLMYGLIVYFISLVIRVIQKPRI